jgi:heme exporter protein C
MWWKTLSVVLITYSIIAGLLVPLKPGITDVLPKNAKTGQTVSARFQGYNSFYTRSQPSEIRVWLQYDTLNALQGRDIKIISDTELACSFDIPNTLPEQKSFLSLNAILDHPADGVSLLPDAMEVRLDTAASTAAQALTWTAQPANALHIKSNFSFPYRNILYETIRNTYFHVPMWFVLLFLFTASVVYSIRYLRKPDPENDRRATAYASVGLLFGVLGLVTGMLWANYTWGAPWSNDIKQLMTAVALLVYLAYFILRSSFDEPEKGARLAATYNIFAFASLIPLLYIVPRLFASLHPGATGNPAFGSQDLDNTMRAVFYPAIIGWTLLGFWIAELHFRIKRIEDKRYEL